MCSAPPHVEAHFARWPTEEDRRSREEMRELARLTVRFVPVAEALSAYVKALSGRPCQNSAGFRSHLDTPVRACPACDSMG